jgi:hypothetical protein
MKFFVLIAFLFLSAVPVLAEEAPSATQTETIYAAADNNDYLEDDFPYQDQIFLTGVWQSYDSETQKATVRVFLDANGDAEDKEIQLLIDAETEITDGEKSLQVDTLPQGADIDIEYNLKTMTATYVYLYL